MKILLQTEKLYKRYGESVNRLNILQNIDLSIMENEITVLMGPSGSGKSTLLNILGTLDRNYSGNVIIDNQNIENISDLAYFRSSKLGFIFQFHHLLPEFTVLENLELPSMILGRKIEKEQLIDMLLYVGLKNCLNKYPNEISGGERQRVAVLRALVNKPKLILADEPTGNLDPIVSDEILDLLENLTITMGTTILMSTHNFPLIQPRGKRFIELDKGRQILDDI